MILLVQELSDEIYQTISPIKNTNIEYIRLDLYKHNNFSGNLSLELHDNNGELITSSADTLSASDISSQPFFHGFVNFQIKAQLQKDMTYRIVLKGTDGYEFTESSYIGWCNSFDLTSPYNPTYDIHSSFSKPLSLEIWSK